MPFNWEEDILLIVSSSNVIEIIWRDILNKYRIINIKKKEISKSDL